MGAATADERVGAGPARGRPPVRTIAGALAGGRAPLAAAVAGDGEAFVLEAAPLGVAATGPRPPDGPVLCVLDGYLFEPHALAEELGLPPGAPDEAVAAAAYLRWGRGALDRLDGELAVVLWDRRERRGLIACDRLGAGPLFLHGSGASLRFASEVRNLLRLLPTRPGPDPVAVARALGGWTLHDGRTLHAGVERLGAGRCVELEPGGWRAVRYWRPRYQPRHGLAREEAAAAIRSGISRAVRRRVREGEGEGERPGVMLSGGLDSSAVAAVGASALGPAGLPPTAYSATFPDVPGADESADLDLLRASLGLPHVRLPVAGGSPLAAALDHLERWELPLGPPNHFAWRPLLARAAADGVEVMLDGAGGDELFALAPYLVADRLGRGRLAGAAGLVRSMPGGPEMTAPELAQALFRYGVKGALPRALADRLRRAPPAPPLLSRAGRRLFDEGAEIDHWRGWPGPRWWSHRAHQLVTGPESLGVRDYTRRRAAAAGLASRHPLMDRELIELVLSLPPEWSFDPTFTRPLLREAGRGLLPEAIRLKRRKALFNRVFRTPLLETDLPAIRALVSPADAEVRAYTSRRVVDEEILAGPHRHRRGEAAWALDAWRLANVECWLRREADPSSPGGLAQVSAAGRARRR